MPATSGERLIARNMGEMAPNHVSRYEWAARELVKRLPKGSKVLDAACGVGYGAFILANVGFEVDCFDISVEAEKYQPYFAHDNVTFRRDDIMNILHRGKEYDAIVSIETIEHVLSEDWIADVGLMTNLMVGTVPNQDVVPFDPDKYKYHYKHFTKTEAEELMDEWTIEEWATQYAKWENYEMVPGTDGMTLGWVASK